VTPGGAERAQRPGGAERTERRGDAERAELPLIVAHRGASAERPEHTLAAYELALRHGADALECDVRLTRDGHLVCVHDRRVDRTSTGRGVVSGMTLQGLGRLDFGSWHDPFPATADELIDPYERGVATPAEQPATPAGLLTLSALLELVVAHGGGARLFAETKHPVRYGGLVEAKLVAELHRFGLARPRSADAARVIMMSFSARAVWRVRRSAPRVPTVLLGRNCAALAGVPGTTAGATAIGPSIAALRADPELVARASAQGRDTYTWTVDTPGDAAVCRELGVRWVATNHPRSMRGWLSAA